MASVSVTCFLHHCMHLCIHDDFMMLSLCMRSATLYVAHEALEGQRFQNQSLVSSAGCITSKEGITDAQKCMG